MRILAMSVLRSPDNKERETMLKSVGAFVLACCAIYII